MLMFRSWLSTTIGGRMIFELFLEEGGLPIDIVVSGMGPKCG